MVTDKPTTYILLKDAPQWKKGTEFSKVSSSDGIYVPTETSVPANLYYTNYIHASAVENNPEWFALKSNLVGFEFNKYSSITDEFHHEFVTNQDLSDSDITKIQSFIKGYFNR